MIALAISVTERYHGKILFFPKNCAQYEFIVLIPVISRKSERKLTRRAYNRNAKTPNKKTTVLQRKQKDRQIEKGN